MKTKLLVCPLTLVAALIAALVISACGGSSNTSKAGTATVTVIRTVGTGAATGSTATAANTTTATGSTTSPTTTGSQAAGGPPACVAADLKPIYLGGSGTAGTIYYSFALRNISDHACHTYGYPGAAFLNAGGNVLPTKVTRRSLNQAGPVAFTISPGHEASFRIAAPQAYRGGADCKRASYLQIIAPNDTVRMRVKLGNGGSACGEATVSQLLPGLAAK